MWLSSARLSVARNRSKGKSYVFCHHDHADTTKFKANRTWWHSILLVGPCRGHTGPVVFVNTLLATMIPGAQFVALESQNHILLENEPAWARHICGKFNAR